MTLNAETLTTLAAASSAHAARIERRTSGEALARRDAQPFHIAAEDARREAQAANGMGTEAGLMWSIATANDRQTAETIAAMVERHAPSETARADLADALRDWTENAAGLEGVEGDGMTIKGSEGAGWTLSPIMLALLRSAIVAIDWHTLASNMLAERALQQENAEAGDTCSACGGDPDRCPCDGKDA